MTVRRARSLSASGVSGVMRSTRPSDAMREPSKIRKGRLSEPGSKHGPTKTLDPTVCIIAECQKKPIMGETLCLAHYSAFWYHCIICGSPLNDGAIERTRGKHCLTCWGKTLAGKAWARARRISQREEREGNDEA